MADDKENVGVALVQLNCVVGDKPANLARTEAMLTDVAGRADIACLPEFFSTGYQLDALGDEVYELAEIIPGETTEALQEMAQRFNLALVAGIVERDPQVEGVLYDSAVLINRRGELVGQYRKTHLYPAEHRYFRPGDHLPVFELEGVRVGVAICFEHAFPHISSTLALRGAQVIFNPSAVPVGYAYLQNLRTRARAQDNQMFVAAVNHVGEEAGVTYCGGSQVADPRGDVVTKAPDDTEAAVVAQLPFDLILDQRKQEPIFRCLRPELYLPVAGSHSASHSASRI